MLKHITKLMKQTIEGWEEFFRDGVREGGRRNLKKKEGGRGRRVPRRGRGVGRREGEKTFPL